MTVYALTSAYPDCFADDVDAIEEALNTGALFASLQSAQKCAQDEVDEQEDGSPLEWVTTGKIHEASCEGQDVIYRITELEINS